MNTVTEPSREIPVIHECDLCVIGASCTGMFAAVRAAQQGKTVALVENNGLFGGVATAGLVNVWHSLWDTHAERQIIAGLTQEVIDRLKKRDAVIENERDNVHAGFLLNTAELAVELDQLVRENKRIRPFLHTRFCAPLIEADGKLTGAIIEDKSGRRAIRAAFFIDASGDGDLVARASLPRCKMDHLQPPTVCAYLAGIPEVARQNPDFNLGKAVHDPQYPNALKRGFLWYSDVVNHPSLKMIAGTRIHNADCSNADQLTQAEMEGRRQVRAIRDIIHDNFEGGEHAALVALASYIGIRQTRQASCLHRLTEKELLTGMQFEDAIANGSYRIDIHHADSAGISFRYLDGTEVYEEPGKPAIRRSWRDVQCIDPTFYQIPYRSMVPQGAKNLLVAGRLVDADRGAFGAVRVMVNCNQMGEAAGVAAALALDNAVDAADVDIVEVRKRLSNAGAIII